jgi:hypothetical protein
MYALLFQYGKLEISVELHLYASFLLLLVISGYRYRYRYRYPRNRYSTDSHRDCRYQYRYRYWLAYVFTILNISFLEHTSSRAYPCRSYLPVQSMLQNFPGLQRSQFQAPTVKRVEQQY